MVVDGLLLDSLEFSALQKPLKEVWVCIRTDGAEGDGTQGNPYNGSTAARFDALMFAMPQDTLIHLGPGIFRTRGTEAPWFVKTGQRFIGAGIYSTTLRLTLPEYSGTDALRRFIISSGVPWIESLEISDLTLDCNLQNQSYLLGPPDYLQYPIVTVAGIEVIGNNIIVRRVRVINFGTRTPQQKDGVVIPK